MNKHMSMPNFKKNDMTKHDFPKNKLFTEMEENDQPNFAAKYDLTSIQDAKSIDIAMDTIPEHVR